MGECLPNGKGITKGVRAPPHNSVECGLSSLETDQALRNGLTLLPHPLHDLRHEDAVHAVSFSPDGRFVVSGSEDNTARVWESTTGQEVARITHAAPVRAVSFSPDGRF